MGLPPFQITLERHRDDVWRLLAASVGPDRADDCFQETIIAALRAYPELGDGANVRAWLLTIASRKAIDEHRATRRRPEPIAEPDPGTGVAPDPREPGPIWARVRELPPKQRSAIALRFVADLAHEEIGAALDCSPEAARRSLHEGLQTLRNDLEQEQFPSE